MTSASPVISVVIPAYNSKRTIVETIQSALAQEDVRVEVIVVDDGSSDNTAAVAESVGDPRVRVVRKVNGGAPSARNAGIAEATGEWVAFLDADDLWVTHKLRTQLEALRGVPNAFAAHAGAYIVDDDMNVLQIRRCTESSNNLLAYLLFQNLPAVASSWVVRRDVLNEIGGFDANLVILEDWDLSIKLARYGEPLNIAEPLTLYRQHPANRSRNLEIHIAPGLTVLQRVFADPSLPPEIRARKRQIYARFYAMLCGGAFRVHRWRACAYWGLRALSTDPRVIVYIAALPLRRISRRLTRRSQPHLGNV
jgi:glycosyltransferase involved in cell wall biosynthesis